MIFDVKINWKMLFFLQESLKYKVLSLFCGPQILNYQLASNIPFAIDFIGFFFHSDSWIFTTVDLI